MEKRKHTIYTIEIKLQAVKMDVEQAMPVKRIARELGIPHHVTVRNWVRTYELKGEEGLKASRRKKGGRKKKPVEEKELEYLRAENALLRYLLESKKKEDTKP